MKIKNIGNHHLRVVMVGRDTLPIFRGEFLLDLLVSGKVIVVKLESFLHV